jgi:hypothetical protein
MKAAGSSKTMTTSYQITWCYIPEKSNLQSPYKDKLRTEKSLPKSLLKFSMGHYVTEIATCWVNTRQQCAFKKRYQLSVISR